MGRIAGVVSALVFVALVVAGFVFRGPLVIGVQPGIRQPDVSADALRRSVETICGELTPRWYTPPEDLDRVASWIVERFAETGLEVTEHRYRLIEGEYRNVIATRRGRSPGRPAILIGAHYDAYGKLPGADDNASGVAVLLVTDTGMLRNHNYHRRGDLPETLDYPRMAEVVQGLHGVLQDE